MCPGGAREIISLLIEWIQQRRQQSMLGIEARALVNMPQPTRTGFIAGSLVMCTDELFVSSKFNVRSERSCKRSFVMLKDLSGMSMTRQDGSSSPRPRYTSFITLKRRQMINKQMPATVTVQASIPSILGTQVQHPSLSSSENTTIVITVVLSLLFLVFALFVIYRLYMRKLKQQERERYRQPRMSVSMRDPIWPGSRRQKTKKTIVRDAAAEGLHGRSSCSNFVDDADVSPILLR